MEDAALPSSLPIEDAAFPFMTVVVPIGPQETRMGTLLPALATLPNHIVEIIFVTAEQGAELENKDEIAATLQSFSVQWLVAPVGRAMQMNAGAKVARGHFLWFLHFDSDFSREALTKLHQSISAKPDALHYFKLAWQPPCPWYLRINQLGANLRSRWFSTPFGDQGFCLAKSIFKAVGGYPERAEYGEDHLLVWHLRQQGYQLNRVDSLLLTSARKYQAKGWLTLTLLYQWLWIKQALPEWWAFIKQKRQNRKPRP